MQRHSWSLLALLLPFAVPAGAQAATPWQEGQNYFLVQPPQPTNVAPGKVEVTEVFSYACPACNQFYPVADRLRQSLPSNAEMDYVSASFNPNEDWPVFQRAYYTAKALGISAKTHDAMFNAVWKTGELAVFDLASGRLKSPAPDIDDIASFYHRAAGISKEQFLAAANSFTVSLDMRRADAFMAAAMVDSTPTIVVNGKYRLTVTSAGGYDQTIELVKWLVAKESK
ncbi:MAG: thiol:disulfide interchange protein DsbA/DsbL [Steroidobacteraceae bacterium]